MIVFVECHDKGCPLLYNTFGDEKMMDSSRILNQLIEVLDVIDKSLVELALQEVIASSEQKVL